MKHSGITVRSLIAFFGLAALAFAQDRPLDNIGSRQYQHEIRPLRLALDRWLHELGLQDAGLSIRLVKASDLPPNAWAGWRFHFRQPCDAEIICLDAGLGDSVLGTDDNHL
jgi:hypothetical protein